MPSILPLKTEYVKYTCCPGENQLNFESHQASHTRYINDEARYKCNKCDSHYKTHANLSRHKKYKHGGIKEKLKKCQQCKKSVLNFKDHLLAHNRTKPYKCSSCKAAFTRNRCLKEHIKIKHIPSQKERNTLTEQESFTEISQIEDNTFSKHLEPINELPSSDIKPSRKAISRFKNELK